MILTFKYGFLYKGMIYGWKNKELYRLPYTNKANMNYPLKKLDQIIIGNKPGYLIGRDRKTIDQLQELTILIDKEYSIIKDEDTPF